MSTGRRSGAAEAAPGLPGRDPLRGGGGPADARDAVRERGMITAETAVVIPGLLLVAFVLVWAISLVAGQLSCIDAARVGARAVARGESIDAARAVALEAAPAGAEVKIVRGARYVRVVVTWASQAPGPLPMPPVTVAGQAVASDESEVGKMVEAQRAQRISLLAQRVSRQGPSP